MKTRAASKCMSNSEMEKSAKTDQNLSTLSKQLDQKFASIPKRINRERPFEIRKKMAEERMEAQSNEINKSESEIKEQTSKEEKKKHLEKQRKLNEHLQNFLMKRHPANFLFKGLPKDPVCQYCLGSGSVMKCGGECSQYFHRACMNKSLSDSVQIYNAILKRKMFEKDEQDNVTAHVIEMNLEKLQCVICTTSSVNVCFVCLNSDANCIQCCYINCGKAYHLKCLKYWPQHKKQYAIGNNIKRLHCPRHVCHTCISSDIEGKFRNCNSIESDKKLIKCMLCPGTYHRLSECIPAGSEFLSETQLICARHQSTKNLKRINIDHCILCSKGGSLICCDACVYAYHQDCLKVPVEDHFICEVI